VRKRSTTGDNKEAAAGKRQGVNEWKKIKKRQGKKKKRLKKILL
jgi:hypothetical protein